MVKCGARILLWIGIILLTANALGFVIPLRHPGIGEEGTALQKLVTLTPEEFLKLAHEPFDSPAEYATRLTHNLHHAIATIPTTAEVETQRVPFTENYILFLKSFIAKERTDGYVHYEFCNVRKALERGIGLCSQQSQILARLLKEAGIRREMIALDGHVVVTALVDEKQNTWWILDPLYGVVIPHDLSTIERKPSLIRKYYQEQGSDLDSTYFDITIERLVEIYGAEGNTISLVGEKYFYDICTFEQTAYRWKWALPLLLMLPWMIFTLLQHRKNRTVKRHSEHW